MRPTRIWFAAVLLNLCCSAQTSAEFVRTLHVSNAEPVKLHLDIDQGDLQILYRGDGEVSVRAVALAGGGNLNGYFAPTLAVEQSDNNVTVRHRSAPLPLAERLKLRIRIDVPYRTEIRADVQQGTLTVRGLLGPVEAHLRKGDIRVSYISEAVHAEVESGSLDFQVIGQPVVAKVGSGNISGQRLEKGIHAETIEGDITLMVVGSSTASVSRGTGRIDVGGAKGALTLSTDVGDLRVQAVPHDDWKLDSAAGTIRLDLPPTLNANLDASADSGELQVERDDILNGGKDWGATAQRIGAGGKLIAAHTRKGKIVIR